MKRIKYSNLFSRKYTCRIGLAILAACLLAAVAVCPVVAQDIQFSLHVSSHLTANEAQRTVATLQGLGLEAFSRYEAVGNSGMWHRVYVGKYNTEKDADDFGKYLTERGLITDYQVTNMSGMHKIAAPDTPNEVLQDPNYVPPTPFKRLVYGRYVGSFKYKHIAEQEAEGLTQGGWPATVQTENVNGTLWYRVYLVPPRGRYQEASSGGLLKKGRYKPGFSIIADMSNTSKVYWTPETKESPDRWAEPSRCGGYSKRGAKLAILRKINEAVPNTPMLAALRHLGYKPAQGPTDISPILQKLGLEKGRKNDYTRLAWGVADYDRKWYGWAIDRLQPSGSTASIGDGLAASNRELLVIKGRKALIMVSDFTLRYNSTDPIEVAKKLKKQHGDDFCIYTIYVDSDEEGMKRARDIALAGGCGNFYDGCRLLTDKVYFGQMIGEIFYGRKVQMAAAIGCPDADGDAVCDGIDICPNTPYGALVDDKGCWVAALGPFFDFNKATVKRQYLPGIKWAADVLKENPNIRVAVAGHTDSIGSKGYNKGLGRRRALSVYSLLVKYGVPKSQMEIRSFGETRPAATNETVQGRARNRRVEIHVLN